MLLSIYGDVIGILTLLMRTWLLIPGCWRNASLGNCALPAQVMAAARCCCLASALSPPIAWRSASTSPVPSLAFANRHLQSYPDLSRPLRIKDKMSVFSYEMCRCFTTVPCQQCRSLSPCMAGSWCWPQRRHRVPSLAWLGQESDRPVPEGDISMSPGGFGAEGSPDH